MTRWHIGGAVVALAAASLSSPAIASGGPYASPTYFMETGGTRAEQQRLFGGRMGVLLTEAPQGMLFLNWRLLHGLNVGPEGARLIERYHWVPEGEDEGVNGWLKARRLVTGAPEGPQYLRLDKEGPGPYQYTPNCYTDATNLATATLKDRVQRHGADDPAVLAWLQAQDQVFYQCSETAEQPLPPLPADAPAWLKADRAYQQSAWLLYAGRYREAAAGFAAIARDTGSPWQSMGLYLTARSYYREMVDEPKGDIFKLARGAVAALIAAPPGTYAQREAVGMMRAVDFRERPEWLFNDLERVLNAPVLTADMVSAFRDYRWLSDELKGKPKPELADWLATLQAAPEAYDEDKVAIRDALPHARARWQKTGDVAWLIAALSLTHPGDPGAGSLAADAAKVAQDHPGWLSAQYHLMRLTMGTAPAEQTRARADRVLALPGLPQTERNLFSGVRVQVATGLPDFVRFALRKPFCKAEKQAYCAGDDVPSGDVTLARTANGWVGFGEEARAIIDRMPLDMRIAVSRSPGLPREMRLDIALTNFPRAVLLRDDASINRVAGDLVTLLPQLAADWRGVIAAKPGAAKRFAVSFAMAKIPGLRTDLANYYRPVGTIRQFQGYWIEWMVLPRGTGVAPDFVSIDMYAADGRYLDGHADDPTCRGKCGAGAFPLHVPGFVEANRARIYSERGAFAWNGSQHWSARERERTDLPKGTVSLWEEFFAYARDHPDDPRSAEALYWLNRITRWGPNPDGLSKRAFRLLHARYPASIWAKRAPYYFN